jgi:sporulation related protein
MADSSSYRSSRGGSLPPRRDANDPARHAVSDPLAELARLIGQDEAFGAIVRGSRQEPQPEPRQPEPVPWRSRTGQSSWEPDDRGSAHQAYAEDARGYSAADHAEQHHAYGHDAQAYAPAHDDQHGYAPAHAGDPAHAQAAAGHDAHDAGGEYYGEGEGHDGHYEGEEEYADPPPERRRGVLVMVAAVIGLALVGTAGAFGYWAWSTGPRGEPPVIKADTAPNKVVPATQGEGAGNKRVYDRFADQGGTTERMVSREEAPVDIKSAPPPPPRQIYPSAGGVYGPSPVPQAAAPAASGVPVNGEPHRVRTESIRPNQVAAADLGQPGQPVAPPLAAMPANVPSPAPAAAPPRPASKSKQAMAPAAAPAEAPAREAAATGGYVVQLSSQKTEEEARSSYKVLATKYASVFGDREPLIKRVNIPDKGTFYRANVGPFATSAEANHFCSNLKIVGGQCIVQKN